MTRLHPQLKNTIAFLLLMAWGTQLAWSQNQKISNSGFESNLRGWNTKHWGSSGTIKSERDTRQPISGRASARIEIQGNDDPLAADWFALNFQQTFSVTAGRTYFGTYKARSSEPVTIAAQIIEADAPHRDIAWTVVNLDQEARDFRVVGASGFSGRARILFHFGQTKRGVQIWLDEVSVIERRPVSNQAVVTVDFARSEPSALDQSGLLLGLKHPGWAEPPDHLIKPLRPKHWRVRPNTPFINRVSGFGATPVVLLSEGWYPGDNPANRPEAPWHSEERARAWVNHCTAVATANGKDVIYDIWNEPDHPTFFTNWPDGNWDNFLHTFKAAHDAIRTVVPDAVIVGPGTSADFPWPLLQRFMDFCLTEGLRVQILATHLFGDTDPSFEEMRDDLLKIRARFIDHPRYAAVGVTQYMATEYGNPLMVHRPGSLLAMLRFMEQGLSDGAMRSTWESLDSGVNTAFNGSLGGLLTSDLTSPRAIWWAKRWYADGAGHRVSASSNNPEIVPLASFNQKNPRESQLLLASRAFGGPAQGARQVKVTLNNLVSSGLLRANATSLPVWVYLAPHSSGPAAYREPKLVTHFRSSIRNETVTFHLSNALEGYDALLIRFSEAEPLVVPSL